MKMNKKRKEKILRMLDEHYGVEYICYLNHQKPYELLIATMLSAQCTDERVNIVTEKLFKKYTSLEAFAGVEIKELEKDIHSTGFYRNKAKNIKACANELLERHNGIVPKDIDLLVNLSGVGRKTANVVRGHIYDSPSVVVDTHVKRISKKLGFTSLDDPVKIEYDLMEVLPKEHWLRYNTQIIAHGRQICMARNPNCEECFLLAQCPWGLKKRCEDLEEENE
jgi:endonuclease-3